MSERPARLLAVAAAAAVALVLGPQQSGALVQQTDNCRSAGVALLAQLDLAGNEVTQVEAVPEYSVTGPGGDERIVGYDIGARLSNCIGWVRIKTDPFCRIRQTYTQGDCQLGGLDHYD